MTVCGPALRDIMGPGAGSMEDVAERIVRQLNDGNIGASSARAPVRFY